MFLFNPFLKVFVPVQLLDMNIEEIAALENEISRTFFEIEKNSKIIFSSLTKLGQKSISE